MLSTTTNYKTSTFPLAEIKENCESRENRTLKSWTTTRGNVDLLIEKTGEVYAELSEKGQIFVIPSDRIKGFPENALQNRLCQEAYLKDTYLGINPSQGSYSITIYPRLKGGMFNPQSWGHATSAIFGEGVVYKIGAGMGHSELHIAATQGHIDKVKECIKKGDDINRINPKGNTPLDDAIRERHKAIETLLRENGAKRSNEL